MQTYQFLIKRKHDLESNSQANLIYSSTLNIDLFKEYVLQNKTISMENMYAKQS